MKKITQKQATELFDNLKYAIKVACWCDKHHEDPQKGDGVPVYIFWEELIERIEGAP